MVQRSKEDGERHKKKDKERGRKGGRTGQFTLGKIRRRQRFAVGQCSDGLIIYDIMII